MRILFATGQGGGHFGPLVPFARECAGAGHDVLVAAPASARTLVERAGFAFAPLGEPEARDAAWAPVFAEVEGLAGPEGDARLREMAEEFWSQHAYAEGEPDRVVLFVRLGATRDGRPVFDKEWVLDAQGNDKGTAMAQLVSVPVAMAVEAVLPGAFPPGVHAAPDDPDLVGRWLVEVGEIADHMAKVNHLGA